ncbi:MAG: hypothetical protein A3F18_01375 [Legionellales bacterium RIFCSPHIGHO2_12_FULL_37_14]|nr:MAG: hypothetical protein A3F18_01375 [Legionellales bacterium RIFCSPHIGHO2_12_FULL_37_14]
MRKNKILAVIGFVISIFFIQPIFSADLDCALHNCTIVIDSGSTKSQLHFFQYDKNAADEAINIEEISSLDNKVSPGLNSLYTEDVNKYLHTLFSKLQLNNSIPVYMYATAGMRLLPKEKQDKLYKEVRKWFATQNHFQLVQLKTISGSDEALYAWLSVNYLQDRLKDNAARNTIGVLDTGGSSVQIAFAVPNEDKISPDDLKHFKLYGKTINLFVHSFLGLGRTDLGHQLIDESDCYTKGYQLISGKIGTGNYLINCTEKIDLLLKVHNVASTVKPVLEKSDVKEWYVMGGASYLAATSPFHFSNNVLQPLTLMTVGAPYYCKTPWDVLTNQFINDPYLEDYCLSSVYFAKLFIDGYGLYENQDIQFNKDAATEGWTLGVILMH